MVKKQITCPNCGAQMEASQMLDMECPYCGSKFRNPLIQENAGREIIRKIVPFKISEAQVKETLFQEFINKNIIPQDIFDKLEIISLEQYYLPMYLFSGNYNADWSCTVIYHNKDRQGNSYEEFKPANGTATGYFARLSLANKGQSLPYGMQTFASVLSLTNDISSNIKIFDPSYLIGENGTNIKVIEKNISINDCWNNETLQNRIEKDARNAAEYQTSGWVTKDFNVCSNWRYNYSDLILLPIWYGRYSYNDQEYYFAMDGLGGNYDFTFPQDSTSESRIWKLIGRGILMILLLGILLFLVNDVISVPQGLLALLGTVFLLFRFYNEYKKSSSDLSSIKKIGKAKFCNEPMPDVTFNYVLYKRTNQILMWVLVGIIGLWSFIASSKINKKPSVEQQYVTAESSLQNQNSQEKTNDMKLSVNETVGSQPMNLRGYVGKYPVSMHLEFDNNNVKGYYSYNSESSKLQLTGIINNNHIELNETTQEGRPTGHFDGMMINGEYSGEFINYKGELFNFTVTSGEMSEQSDIRPQQEDITIADSAPLVGIRCELMGNISTIEDVKMVLRGNHGTLTYVMDGERIESNIELDYEASNIDENGFGHLVLKSFTPNGKLKGRFIGEMDSAECGYLYEGQFVNVNGGSTTFFFSE